ncbi:MAG: PEP-CTERM sorting domain-containing protein [Thermoguttaceae bacterium]|nr:PEP-CTERM sorting domain-containing protein [Thermoguttaceae bacterium]
MFKTNAAVLSVLAVLLVSAAAVQADDLDYYWTGAASNTYWATGNWNVDSPIGPVATSGLDDTSNSITAYIIDSKGGTINLDFSRLGNAVKTVNVGGTDTPVSISRTGGSLAIEANKTLNVMSNGTFGITQALTIDASGALTVNGGTVSDTGAGLFINGDLNVASGTFTFNNGSNQIQTNGAINVTGGTFNVSSANSIRIGNAANASLNVTNGEVIIDAPAYIGVSANTGTINQSGGSVTFNWPLDFGWGNGAVGEYNLTGGTLTTTSDAGLWSGNPNGISTFTVDGGTANFNKSGESFTVGLGGTNELANVFTLSSGTVNAADVFAVKYGGVLNVAGGKFNAQTVTVDGRSSFNMTDGIATVKSMDMNGGTFIQEGGILNGTNSLVGSYTLGADATFVPEGTFAVSGTATLNGTVDLTNYTNYVGTYGETLNLVTATTVAGTPSIANAPADWTVTPTATGLTATYEGGEGKAYWTGATNNTYYTGSNWTINGVQVTDTYIGGNPAQYNKDCYILTTNGSVNVDWSDLGVASLTVGNGIGGDTGTAEISRGGATYVKTNLTINKGGTATIGGALSITSLNNVPGTLTVNGGTFNANNTTEVTGNLVVDDGNFNAKGGTTVNDGGKITVNGGAFTYASSSNFVDNGNITVTGGDFIVNEGSGTFRVGGGNNDAVLNVEGGKATFGSAVYIATSTNGTINQSGGETEFNGDLVLGWGNFSGTYNLSGGVLTTNGAAGLWNANGSGISTFNVEGGEANFNREGESFTIGLGGTNELANVFNLLSGTVNAADTFAIKYGGKLNAAQTRAGDGVLNAKAITIDTNGVLDLSSGTINIGEGGITSSDDAYTINLAGGTFGTNGASWSSALDATIADGATVTFAPEEGQTIEWAGDLNGNGIVNVSGSGAFKLVGTVAGNVYVEDGAELIGEGSVLGDLTLDGNMNINLDELDTLFTVNGAVAGDGTIQFFADDFMDYLDQQVPFLTSAGSSLGDISSLYSFPEISEEYMWTYGQNGNLFWVGVTEAGAEGVPEPSTWALLVLGVAGLMYWRKK